jgi:hypothetical protein
MINKIEQSIISSILWSYQLTKDEEAKVNSIPLDTALFTNTFHKSIVSLINEFRGKGYLVDEMVVSDALIKRNMMVTSQWFELISQSAGGYQFVTTYFRFLKDNSKMAVFNV